MIPLGVVFSRLLQTLKLDRDAFVWMEYNDRATGDAALLVGITSILLALGQGGSILDLFNPFNLLSVVLGGFILWIIYTGAVFLISKFLLDGHGTFATVFRITGFAFPTLLLMIASNVLFDTTLLIVAAGGAWFVIIVAFGLMYAADLARERAFAASIGGWIAYVIIQSILAGIRLFLTTYRLDLAYDGSGFHGYAKQPDVRTVQGDLEMALFPHTRRDITTFVAGRTDKGVHASEQVVSFSCRRHRYGPCGAIPQLPARPGDRGPSHRRGGRWLSRQVLRNRAGLPLSNSQRCRPRPLPIQGHMDLRRIAPRGCHGRRGPRPSWGSTTSLPSVEGPATLPPPGESSGHGGVVMV